MALIEREVRWAGRTRRILRGFPEDVRWAFGGALYKIQLGKRSQIASLMKGKLRGIKELRAITGGDTYRLYFTLNCPGYSYVLYCHKKKSKRGIAIPTHEEQLIVQRLNDAIKDCSGTGHRRYG